jgi:hypothetical protein
MGDNRESCFYIPLGFLLIDTYIQAGFILDELVSRRGWTVLLAGEGRSAVSGHN